MQSTHWQWSTHVDVDGIKGRGGYTDATAVPSVEGEEKVLRNAHTHRGRVVARDLHIRAVEEPNPWRRGARALC